MQRDVSVTGESSLPRRRRLDLDRAKGLAILLVVLGHIVAREPPAHNHWYVLLQSAIYQFHMPFFMYLSGYVTFLSGAAAVSVGAWPRLFSRRVARLLVPFLIFGMVIVVGKLVTSRVMYVDNLPTSFSDAMLGLFWDTDSSPSTSVWYIAVLFVYCVLTPPLIWLAKGRLYLVLVLAALLYFMPLPHIMYADRIAAYYAFFAMGLLAARYTERWTSLVDRGALISLACLFILLSVRIYWEKSLPDSIWLLLCGAISMPALHGLVRRAPLSNSETLVRLGALSFVIYLLNTPFIGLAKGLLLKSMSWDGPNFLIFAPVLMAAGLFGPILTKRFVFRRVRVVDQMTD